ncbi:hypothetical protein NPX13_g3961 [Xylaria arbuscula]|uniref:Uncharacterized protein n=1 Tax=Xylaria arbuscula TaxID=114810 RepID=A0A9W8TMC8_9PEZI|nr:hypothetical protein NPX13_g3961 [Xylaria arbuscula]
MLPRGRRSTHLVALSGACIQDAASTPQFPSPQTPRNPGETTPRPDEAAAASKNTATSQSKKADAGLSTFDLVRHAEHSMLIHLQSGDNYENENPITGKPGAWHLSKTGRTANLQVPGITALNTNLKSTSILDIGVGGNKKKDGVTTTKSGEKTPKTPTSGTSKLKRKKSKTGQTPTSS